MGKKVIRENTSLSNGNIVIIEDDIDIRIAYELILEKEGYNTYSFESGDEIERLENPGSIDGVIMDLNVPGENTGEKLFHKINKTCFDSQIIIATGEDEAGAAINLRLLGASAYLRKPISNHELAETIKDVINTKNRAKEELIDKIKQLSGKYTQPGSVRNIFLLKKDLDLITNHNLGDNILSFDCISQIEQYIKNIKPQSKDGNAVVIIRDGYEGVQNIIKNQNERVEVPIIGVIDSKKYTSEMMLKRIESGFFDFVPNQWNKLDVATHYAFLAHREKYDTGVKEQITLREAKKRLTIPTALISCQNTLFTKNLDQYLTLLGIEAKVVEPREYRQMYNQMRPKLVFLNPLDMILQSLYIGERKKEIINLEILKEDIVDVIPKNKIPKVMEYITNLIKTNKEFSSLKMMALIDEKIEDLTRAKLLEIEYETSRDGALFFTLDSYLGEYAPIIKKIAKDKKIKHLSTYSRPYTTTRIALSTLASEVQKNQRFYDKDTPPNAIYVIAGPSGSGKTVTAAKLGKKIGNAVVIGNIKPGEKRPGEKEKDTFPSKDVYLKPEIIEAIKQQKFYPAFYDIASKNLDEDVLKSLIEPFSYDHFGNQYHLLWPRITKELKNGKNVIVITNLEGLKQVKEMKKVKVLNNDIISYLLMSQQPILEGRQQERLEDKRITPEEFQKRVSTLGPSLQEYMASIRGFDALLHTDRSDNIEADIEERVNQIIQGKDEIIRKGTVEYKENYIPMLFGKLTHLQLGMEYLEGRPIKLHADSLKDFLRSVDVDDQEYTKYKKLLQDKKIIANGRYAGTLTLVVDKSEKDENERRVFNNYLQKILGEPAEKNEKISFYPASFYGGVKVSYAINEEVINVSDVAKYSLQSEIKTGLHSLAIISLDNYDPKKGKIKIEKLEK